MIVFCFIEINRGIEKVNAFGNSRGCRPDNLQPQIGPPKLERKTLHRPAEFEPATGR